MQRKPKVLWLHFKHCAAIRLCVECPSASGQSLSASRTVSWRNLSSL
ncbi:rCG27933 [Rattus norvegicus]|uniref:RCG27933 n=1 Tax=Rattus norvegicus TaxID=10116 RepID=A6IET5_RAT|nr:rCG27933 [Rattus norvegicus]